jgi:hypothetical protein
MPLKRLVATRPVRPLWSPLALIVLVFQVACATGLPPGGQVLASSFRYRPLTPPPAPREVASSDLEEALAGATVCEVDFLEPAPGANRPVPIHPAAYKQALQRLAREAPRLEGTPQQAARELLEVWGQEEEAERVSMSGHWVAESYRGRVYSLTPTSQTGPVPLTPEAEAALRGRYLGWCEGQGGGDCLGLLDDGPYLRANDRRTLALALSLGSVLEETREALARELLDYRALVGMLVWTLGVYLALWLVPEPTTKALAATLTVILVGWLGLETVWGLMDGWAHMASLAHEATTFEELRAAGAGYAKVLGTDAARAMILAVATLTGRTLGEVAAKVRTLPGYRLAGAQWEAQGGAAVLRGVPELEAVVVQEGALATAVQAVEMVATSPQGPVAAVLLKKGGGGSSSPGGGSAVIVIRHRGGNFQVVFPNGARWHVPRGKSVADIPSRDEVGDRLQEAVIRAAREWGPHRLTPGEQAAIQRARDAGKYWLARLLEREARGRYVHERVKRQFDKLLKWNHQGVDAVDLKTGRKYELLSGTESNLALHGRRMATEFFRMLTF